MEIAVTPRPDDTYIERAWKHAETDKIENLAAALLGKAQDARSIEDDLFCILYLAFRRGFKTTWGSDMRALEKTASSFRALVASAKR